MQNCTIVQDWSPPEARLPFPSLFQSSSEFLETVREDTEELSDLAVQQSFAAVSYMQFNQ